MKDHSVIWRRDSRPILRPRWRRAKSPTWDLEGSRSALHQSSDRRQIRILQAERRTIHNTHSVNIYQSRANRTKVLELLESYAINHSKRRRLKKTMLPR